MNIQAYFTQHWADGKPTGAWWMGENLPKLEHIGEGFFVVRHPAQELEMQNIQCYIERTRGIASRIEEYKPITIPKKWFEFWK